MKDNCLLWEFMEDSMTPITIIFEKVKANMERSRFTYRFVGNNGFLVGHEGLGLTLLSHVNRGHLTWNRCALRPTSYSASTTIEDLLSDKLRFAVSAHNLGFYGNFFVINAG